MVDIKATASNTLAPESWEGMPAMILIFGLVLLVAAVIVGVAGVLGNTGTSHSLTHGFSVFGYHVTGSTGTLFLYGIVVGAIAVFGLSLLLASARRSARRGRVARRGLKQSRRENAALSQDRDDMIDQRDAARAETASATRDRSPQPQSRLPRFGRRSDGGSDAGATAADR
jgi:gas vesicle protein